MMMIAAIVVSGFDSFDSTHNLGNVEAPVSCRWCVATPATIDHGCDWLCTVLVGPHTKVTRRSIQSCTHLFIDGDDEDDGVKVEVDLYLSLYTKKW
mmetsp:Transcript_16634/g.18624  ORF Transcript_16634/g.18624 Transcript_16634/m.18624 type:complete len:96 (+) Transcript_16634:285-572(+)